MNTIHATDYPALDGRPVTERHARTCRERGHATHTIDGQDAGSCPRCGEATGVVDVAGYRTNEDGSETLAYRVDESGRVSCVHAAPGCCAACVEADHRLYRNHVGDVSVSPMSTRHPTVDLPADLADMTTPQLVREYAAGRHRITDAADRHRITDAADHARHCQVVDELRARHVLD